jgi:hypothetical protein
MQNSGEVFRNTMSRFEEAFTVGLISTDNPITCTLNDLAGEVFSKYEDFDQFPVCDEGEVIGVLERNRADKARHVSDQSEMISIREGILIAEDEPLDSVIAALQNQPYFLVLRGRKLNALVTRSDLVKLPVQLLSLTSVIHLEQIMSQLIRNIFGASEEWTKHLDEYQRKRVWKAREKLRQQRSNPDLLELTYFPDKCAIIAGMLGENTTFGDDKEELGQLRNDLSHPKDFIGNAGDGLDIFLRRLSMTRKWIEELPTLISNTSSREGEATIAAIDQHL